MSGEEVLQAISNFKDDLKSDIKDFKTELKDEFKLFRNELRVDLKDYVPLTTYNELVRRVAELESDRSKVIWLVISTVVLAVLTVTLKLGIKF